MSLRKKGLVLAMEDDVAEDDFSSNEIPETVAEVEVDAAEIQTGSDDIEEISDAAEEASDDVDTLEGIQDVMAESVEKGEGLDETAAEIAEVAIEAICARLGIKAGTTMPAMESFGSSNSRVAATKIAMEGIADKVKSILKAIQAAFVKAWEAIVEFYKTHAAVLGRLQKLATSLKDQAAKAGVVKADAGTISNSTVLSAFNIGGKVDATTARSVIEGQIALTKKILSAKSSLDKVVSEVTTGATDFESFNKANFEKAVTEFVVKVKVDSGSLVGGATLLEVPEVKGDSTLSRIMCKIEVANNVKKVESAPILDKTQMADICGGVSELVKQSEAYNKEQGNITKLADNIKKSLSSLINNAEKMMAEADKNADTKKAFNEIRKEIEGMSGLLQRIAVTVPSLNMKAAKAGLGYVNDSLKKYETDKAE